MEKVERINDLNQISFPNLGFDFFIDPVAFTVFGVEIKWYGILITLGVLIAILYCYPKMKKFGLDSDRATDAVLGGIFGSIVGARAYYVIFNLPYYLNHPDQIIAVWNGGLAIHGGLIAGVFTMWAGCRYYHIRFWQLADILAPLMILGQAIGRWGNFMNGEAFGSEATNFLRMGIFNYNSYVTFDKLEMVYVHPTFLYESLWNLTGVLLVYLFAKFIGKKYDGQLILLTFGWYGLGRMFIEGLRTDSLYIPGTELRTSQVLAAAIFVVCLGLLIYFFIKKWKK